MKVKIKKLHPDAIAPKYQTSGSAGFDLHALEDVELKPGETKLIKTGLSFEVPESYVLDIRPRSGMSLKTYFRVANSPGTVDSDFRGEICVIGQNTFTPIPGQLSNPIKIKKGDRIAQGVFVSITQGKFEFTNELSETERGTGGCGSTGSN